MLNFLFFQLYRAWKNSFESFAFIFFFSSFWAKDSSSTNLKSNINLFSVLTSRRSMTRRAERCRRRRRRSETGAGGAGGTAGTGTAGGDAASVPTAPPSAATLSTLQLLRLFKSLY